MPPKPRWTKTADAEYKRLESEARGGRQRGLFKQVDKAIRMLVENPRHPGLQTHEFHSMAHPFDSSKKVFEAYAQNQTPGAYRIFWCHGPERGQITIVAITPHP